MGGGPCLCTETYYCLHTYYHGNFLLRQLLSPHLTGVADEAELAARVCRPPGGNAASRREVVQPLRPVVAHMLVAACERAGGRVA